MTSSWRTALGQGVTVFRWTPGGLCESASTRAEVFSTWTLGHVRLACSVELPASAAPYWCSGLPHHRDNPQMHPMAEGPFRGTCPHQEPQSGMFPGEPKEGAAEHSGPDATAVLVSPLIWLSLSSGGTCVSIMIDGL